MSIDRGFGKPLISLYPERQIYMYIFWQRCYGISVLAAVLLRSFTTRGNRHCLVDGCSGSCERRARISIRVCSKSTFYGRLIDATIIFGRKSADGI